ncbi:serine hydrolase [Actinomadura sp. J1-007]|uniref:serine hydrolase domain-containing protein n=1 Tax=Actinomadura sp. J1-007 TaxID=2661913 RepID=UPI001371E81D|nr:serine hydrolase domain-containing protein [Actinomadura sp. J1-007]
MQKAMEDLAKAHGVVGSVGGAYVDGKPIGVGSAGSRLLGGKGGKIPANSRFRIGSQTKEMVATVVLQLVGEGRLGVDDKLADLLPEVAENDLVERAGEITVRQMIRHTSGIPDWYAGKPNPDGSEGEDPSFDVFDFTTHYRPLDLVKWSRARPRTGEPGEKWSYSNTNYTLLGMVVERVTGHDLAAELHGRLFGPLGMTKTYLPLKPPEASRGRTATATTPTPTAGRATSTGSTPASPGRPGEWCPPRTTSARTSGRSPRASCCRRNSSES